MLQGFESYQGKLIAHSLGNFIFDLYYTETMPTMVLTLEVEKTGITGYRFTPAWINHWIPEPATGNLGREIVGRLADYSLPMNAVVVPIPDSNEARIHLTRADLDSTLNVTQSSLTLTEIDGYAVSEPLLLAGKGNLSQVEGLTDGGPWEVRWGREILWHGGFEDEGADLWDDNSDDEVLVTDIFHGGERSLRLRRQSGDSGQTGTDLEKHLPCDPPRNIRPWAGSVPTTPIRPGSWCGTTTAGIPGHRWAISIWRPGSTGPPNGSGNGAIWKRPATASYFDMRCGHEPPSSDTGYSWYDDLAFIEWEPWVPGDADKAIPAPNNYRFLQIRSADTGATAFRFPMAKRLTGKGMSAVSKRILRLRRPLDSTVSPTPSIPG